MPACCKYYVPAYLRMAGTFRIKTARPEIFLTFDDGPSPEATPFVLDTLQQAKAKASFFCSGEEAEKYPELFTGIKNNHHKTGNHGYAHLNGFKTKNADYFSDIENADNIIHSPYFRPPYGKIKPSQYFVLKEKYKIIFWTILTRDFDSKTTWQEDFKNIKPYIQKGAIIVFHDSPKANQKLRNLLPAILDYGIKQGFSFTKIEL